MNEFIMSSSANVLKSKNKEPVTLICQFFIHDDKKRNEQIDSRNEQFVSIQKIIECHALLSGTTTIVYLGVGNEQHNIKVIYPFDTFQINTDELIGAIYVDGLIVPVSGDIEKCIKRELELHENDNESYKKVLRFLTSEEYLEMALLLGRVKKAL